MLMSGKESKVTVLRITERKRCPQIIKEEFQAIRMAPKSFIDWHRMRAEEELAALCSYSGAKVHNQWMARDLWCGDGFEALHAIIETQKEKLLKIKWNEGSQYFMRQSPNSGAWMSMFPEEMDNQEFVDLMCQANKSSTSTKEENNKYTGTFE